MKSRLLAALLSAVALATLLGATLAGTAAADPTGAKNAFGGTAMCGPAGSFQFVVNNANGQGGGTENNGAQAEFAPAHLNPGNGVFHPTAFDLTFTFTPVSGPPEISTDTASRPNQTGNVTCTITGSATNPFGTFSLSGTVVGWIS